MNIAVVQSSFPYKAVLRDTRDGSIHEYSREWNHPKTDAGIDLLRFQWMENNYSCDCNRTHAIYPADASKRLECSGAKNVIELIELWADGVRLI